MTRQWSTTPEMLGGRAQVVARDALGNPIANAGVNVFIDSGGGALLTSDQFNTYVLDQGGMILLDELSAPQTSITNQMTVSDGKFAVYTVLGPASESGNVDIKFSLRQGDIVVSNTTTMEKTAPEEGTILYAWSARPTGSAGQFIEAYHPGSEISRPMVLDLFRVEPDVHPVRAPEDELRPVFAPVGCPAGTALVDAPAGKADRRMPTRTAQ